MAETKTDKYVTLDTFKAYDAKLKTWTKGKYEIPVYSKEEYEENEDNIAKGVKFIIREENKDEEGNTTDVSLSFNIKTEDGYEQISSDNKQILFCYTMEDFPATGKDELIYLDESENLLYRWDGSKYVSVGGDNDLGADDVKYNNETSELEATNMQNAIDEIVNISKNFITKEVDDLTNYTLSTDTGTQISAVIDPKTYVMTITLKNAAGDTLGNEQKIDLPLESMIVNGAYDSENKKLILTLNSTDDNGNANVVKVDVKDLIAGLVSEERKIADITLEEDIAAIDLSEKILPTFNTREELEAFETENGAFPVGTKIIITSEQSGGGASSADKISYDNSESGLAASNLQDAVDEIKDEFHAEITHVNTSLASKISAPEMAEGQIATIGQVLAVKAVDDEGKPTEWEVVDQSGGEKTGEKSYLIGNSWFDGVDVPFPCSSAVYYKGEIHILGGSNNSKAHYKLNANGEWISVSTLPYDMGYGGVAIVWNDEIHILGSSNSSSYRDHYKFDGTSWNRDVSLPISQDFSECVVCDNKLYISGQSYFGCLSVESSTWQSLSRVPYTAYSRTLTALNNKIYMMGGVSGSSYYNYCYEYTDGSWTQKGNLPYAMVHTASVEFNGVIHTFGGGNSTSYQTLHHTFNGVSWKVDSPTTNNKSGNLVFYKKAMVTEKAIILCDNNALRLFCKPNLDI